MPIKRIKDESKLIAKWKIKAGRKYYFHVFLWEDQEAFDQNTKDTKPNTYIACVNLSPTIIEILPDSEREFVRPKLGEVHFIKGKWDMEIVAHELCHALIQRIRMIGPYITNIVEQVATTEEDLCYEYGMWVGDTYRQLWEADPR